MVDLSSSLCKRLPEGTYNKAILFTFFLVYSEDFLKTSGPQWLFSRWHPAPLEDTWDHYQMPNCDSGPPPNAKKKAKWRWCTLQSTNILWMEENLQQLIGLSHYLKDFNHPRWCRISQPCTGSYGKWTIYR